LSQPFSGGTGVVDQNVELRLVAPVRGGQRRNAFVARHVDRQCDALAAALRQLLRRLLADIRFARGDIDARALRDETLRDHLADTARAAGDQGDAALQ
jgi:hypothetical protein